MARLVHVERDEVKAASAALNKLLAKDPIYREHKKRQEAEKARRDREFAATPPRIPVHGPVRRRSLEPFFSLSPLSPFVDTYDPANRSARSVSASISTYGGATKPYARERLEDLYANDQILLWGDPVDPETEQTITGTPDIYQHCAVNLNFSCTNVTTANQYLLVFRLKSMTGTPVAQFFVGTSMVHAETLTDSPYDDIAILADAPGGGWAINIYVRLAAPSPFSHWGFYFKGVDCYLL
jgi:hypothetical protein